MPVDKAEIHKLRRKFKVDDLWIVANDAYYADKVLKVTNIDKVGVSFEDENEELGNRLSVPTAHYWGWPPIQHHLENGTLRPYKPVETAQTT